MLGGLVQRILFRLLLTGAVLYAGLHYLSGISLTGDGYDYVASFLFLTIIVVIIDIAIHPVLKVLLTPLRLITFGLTSIALSVGIVYTIAHFFDPFIVTSWLHGVLLGGMLGILRKVMR
ncbi:MAG: phage holin family protein [Candidatus Kaiserbacteria bacterium]|nr:phage holin family protein [Candidatus Kaiserbacteria bacterium]